MKPDYEDSKNHILWCLNQKRGIEIEDPNNDLCKAYIRKAKSALNMLLSAIEKDETDWIAATSYYSRYFAFYALLKKCGIKSEIHECTISLMDFLFVKEKTIEKEFYDYFKKAKIFRIDAQYYVSDEMDEAELKDNARTTSDFLLKMEEIIERMDENKINKLRNKIIDLKIKNEDD